MTTPTGWPSASRSTAAALTAVAYRMLGSSSEADDAVQEAWLRLSRTDADAIENLGGWLTTVVARVCLNMLQARRSRPRGAARAEPRPSPQRPAEPTRSTRRCWPTRSASRCWSCSTRSRPPSGSRSCCTTCSRMPFDEIAPIVDRSPPATRQLASRARRRVQGQDDDAARPDRRPPARARRRLPRRRPRRRLRRRCSRCSTPTSCCAPTQPRSSSARRARPAARDAVGGVRAPCARAPRRRSLDGAPARSGSPGGEPRVVYRFATQRRPDHRDRPDRRPRAPARARPGSSTREAEDPLLARQAAERHGHPARLW